MKAVELVAYQNGSWRKIASLTMSALSINIGAHFSMHSMKSAISV
jgi:hypothetical protein